MKKLIIVALSVGLVGVCRAQLVVGNDAPGSSSIYYIDLASGNSTALYTGTDFKAKPWGIAADNYNNMLYWCHGTKLMRASFASLRSVSPTIVEGPMRLASGSQPPISFVELAFNPATYKLIGSTNVPTKALYEIDPVTRLAKPLYTFGSSFDFGGLDCDASGNIFGINDIQTSHLSAPLHRSLYQISSNAPTHKLDAPDSEFDIDGLAIGSGKAYLVTDGPSNMQGQIHTYNLATGFQEMGVIPSPFVPAATFSGASFAPNLAANTAWLSGTLNLRHTEPTFASGVRKRMRYAVVQGTTIIYQSHFIVTQSSTAFSVPVPSSVTGPAMIIWDGSTYLLNKQDGVLTGGNLSVGTLELFNGDVDDSGEVDSADIDEVIAKFGATWYSVDCEKADCDGNGEVDSADIDITIASFGEVNGYPWTWP